MDAVAVIAECNPFHLGHKYLFSSIREKFPDAPLIVILSGDYVQRGEFSIADKYLRAATLIEQDVDLVLELPFPHSMLSADGFSRAGVFLAASLGCVSRLAFACEHPDLMLLKRAAALLSSKEFEAALSSKIKSNPDRAYATLREEVFYELGEGFPPDLIRSPNCILALSYIMALEETSIEPIVFPRIRTDADGVDDVSGQRLRARMVAQDASWKNAVPAHTCAMYENALSNGVFPVVTNAVEQVVLYTLRNSSPEKISECYGCAPLAHRIRTAADESTSLEPLYQKVSVAQFPAARIRRSILSAVLGVKEECAQSSPSFSLVLGANQTGRRLLRALKKKATIPIYTKPAHAVRDSVLPDIYCRAEELYGLAFPVPREKNWYLKMTPRVREV